eukprot:COSAG06_NODE_9583_length_1865_cov_0.843715_1_plen_123_part_00
MLLPRALSLVKVLLRATLEAGGAIEECVADVLAACLPDLLCSPLRLRLRLLRLLLRLLLVRRLLRLVLRLLRRVLRWRRRVLRWRRLVVVWRWWLMRQKCRCRCRGGGGSGSRLPFAKLMRR